jgi:UDP-galactopyranose mutase
MFDFLIVGAGFAGSVLAERLARTGKKILILDKRNHIGGNAYDHYDDAGVLVHKYGPHIFHTNSKDVFEYLSQFTEWRPYEHRVLASVDGQLVPMPINLDTINKLYNMNLTSGELEAWFESVAEPVETIRTSEDVVVSKVGRELYEKFFKNYTRKQWALDPSELDKSVTARVPTRTTRDDRYFTDSFQAMPVHGYTRMFEKMLAHPNIKVMLNTDYHEVLSMIPFREMIFSGPVDEYFDFKFGKLPYRSLGFKHLTIDVEKFLPAAVVNYPNEHAYTRVTEFKALTGQTHSKTSVVYEYPTAEGDPYYPIPKPENAELYARYKAMADTAPNVHFVGRLATYKYYNMDQVVAQALTLFKKLAARDSQELELESVSLAGLKTGLSQSRVAQFGKEQVTPFTPKQNGVKPGKVLTTAPLSNGHNGSGLGTGTSVPNPLFNQPQIGGLSAKPAAGNPSSTGGLNV